MKQTVEHAEKAGWAPEGAGPVLIRFEANDPEDPQEGWTTAKRWRVLFVALFVTYTSAFNASSNGQASGGFRKEHPGVTSAVFQASSFTFLVMLGIGPLVLAPISETFGRRWMLVSLTLVICLLFLPQALAPNVEAIIITRLFQGICACIEGPVAAGVVADLFKKQNRGIPMGLFVLHVFGANATGPLCAGWIAQTLGWRYIYWVQMGSGGLCFLLCLFLFPETYGALAPRLLFDGRAHTLRISFISSRGNVILQKRADKLTKETGREHRVEGVESFEGWGEAVKISCSRPLLYLFTEPIVTALALWLALAWGSVFLLIGVVTHVMSTVYGFSQGQAATCLITGFIGAAIGFLLHGTVQEGFYQRALARGHGKAKPEVRLYSCAVGGWAFALGCFGFGWTARQSIHFIVPCIFLVILNLGIYTIYLATYLYIGDVYERYSSSGQAAQSLLRNILGATFPFFALIMYERLGTGVASSVVGAFAAFFAFVPWLLLAYGERLRMRSLVAVAMELERGDILADEASEIVEPRA